MDARSVCAGLVDPRLFVWARAAAVIAGLLGSPGAGQVRQLCQIAPLAPIAPGAPGGRRACSHSRVVALGIVIVALALRISCATCACNGAPAWRRMYARTRARAHVRAYLRARVLRAFCAVRADPHVIPPAL